MINLFRNHCPNYCLTEENLSTEKPKAEKEFNQAKLDFDNIVKNYEHLLALHEKDRNYSDSDKILQELRKPEVKQTYPDAEEAYNSYLKAFHKLKEIKEAEGYFDNLKNLKEALNKNNVLALQKLKDAIWGALSYIEKNRPRGSMSDSVLTKIIISMRELLEPTIPDQSARIEIQIQKLHFNNPRFSYFYDFESTRRYKSFVANVDLVSGGRSMTQDKFFLVLMGLAILAFGLLSIILVALVRSADHTALIIYAVSGIVGFMMALTTHLLNYPRTGFAKQLAIVADAAFDIENKRLYEYELNKVSEEFTKTIDQLLDNCEDEFLKPLLINAANHIKNTYDNDGSRKKGLQILQCLEEIVKVDSLSNFYELEKKLHKALSKKQPQENCFSFLRAKEAEEPIHTDIQGCLDSVKRPLLEKAKISAGFNS